MGDLTGGDLVMRLLARESGGRRALWRSRRVPALNVILDPDAYRREGGGSLAI